MAIRDLSFDSFDSVLAEIERLHARGYRRNGAWSLGQICDHLSYYLRGSLDGFGFKLPWILRAMLGPPLKRKLLGDQPMPRGGRTIPASVPPAGVADGEAVARFRELAGRFEARTEALHPSPLFGEFTKDQWRKLHLRHAAHHLAFLEPLDS